MEYPWGVQVGIVIIGQVAFVPGLAPNIWLVKRARARMVPYFQIDLDLRPNYYFILEYSWWLQVEVIRTPLYGQINPF